ncbi:PREDICTED: diphthamide biosynthesis [Prunus dulcis]|uniref:Diphthamide biosynthesis protein 3 n=4 Tax=Prunus TaxID=3754 RepID=A0A5E4EHW3_PRUDU|nr:PREDICTED: diphthamide biosynthesis [Prunus dulcis]
MSAKQVGKQVTRRNFPIRVLDLSIQVRAFARFQELTNPNPNSGAKTMSYDDVEIEDMEWNNELQAYTYPCPCGDLFQITKEDLKLGEEIARCPSCSLYITVVYNVEDFLDKKSNKPIEPSKQQPITVA